MVAAAVAEAPSQAVVVVDRCALRGASGNIVQAQINQPLAAVSLGATTRHTQKCSTIAALVAEVLSQAVAVGNRYALRSATDNLMRQSSLRVFQLRGL